jgi:hypothetical protein
MTKLLLLQRYYAKISIFYLKSTGQEPFTDNTNVAFGLKIRTN